MGLITAFSTRYHVFGRFPSLSEIVQGEGGIELTSVRKKEAELLVSKSSLLLRIMT